MAKFRYSVSGMYNRMLTVRGTLEAATAEEAISQLSSMYGQGWEKAEGKVWYNVRENLTAVIYKA